MRITARCLIGMGLIFSAVPGAPAPQKAAAHQYVQQPITFRAQDGVLIRGFQFGNGRPGQPVVIFSHMWGTDQSIWFPLARLLAGRGYTAITYNYRGIGGSGGRFVIANTYRDAVGAVAFATRQGRRPIVLVGASMGGTVSLKAAAMSKREVDAVVVMASGLRFQGLDVHPYLPRLRIPKLFISGIHDQPFATSVRTMYRLTDGPKALRLYPTGAHGTHLFATRYGLDVRNEILTFVDRHTRPVGVGGRTQSSP